MSKGVLPQRPLGSRTPTTAGLARTAD